LGDEVFAASLQVVNEGYGALGGGDHVAKGSQHIEAVEAHIAATLA
jgi:hypothetical protein